MIRKIKVWDTIDAYGKLVEDYKKIVIFWQRVSIALLIISLTLFATLING